MKDATVFHAHGSIILLADGTRFFRVFDLAAISAGPHRNTPPRLDFISAVPSAILFRPHPTCTDITLPVMPGS